MVDHPSVAYLRRLFGETTEGPIFLCSLPNDKGKGDGGVKTRHCVGPDCAQQIYSFVNHHDQIGRGTYYTMSTVKEGQQRTALDLRYVGFHIPPEFVVGYGLDVDERLRNLHAIHAYAGPSS